MSKDLESLIHDLAVGNDDQRLAAAKQLAGMELEAAPAGVALIEACGGGDELREWANSALESMGPPPRKLLAGLIPLLADARLDVAYWAATLIGRLGPEAGSARESLQSCELTSAHEAVRKRASWALVRIGRSG